MSGNREEKLAGFDEEVKKEAEEVKKSVHESKKLPSKLSASSPNTTGKGPSPLHGTGWKKVGGKQPLRKTSK